VEGVEGVKILNFVLALTGVVILAFMAKMAWGNVPLEAFSGIVCFAWWRVVRAIRAIPRED
jgi:hypothetical protein